MPECKVLVVSPGERVTLSKKAEYIAGAIAELDKQTEIIKCCPIEPIDKPIAWPVAWWD